MEKLVIDRLDETITVPVHLDFDCSDRSQLLDQLRVLQMVLRKERDRNEEASSNQQNSSTPVSVNKTDTSITNSKGEKLLSEDLKMKIERNKQAAILRREAKLKELDAKAALLTKPQTFVSESDDVEKERKQTKKRNGTETKITETKKHKIGDSYPQKELNDSSYSSTQTSSTSQASSHSSSSSSSTPSGSSLIENFTDCKSVAAREQLRREALDKMRKSGYAVSVVEPGGFALKYALSAPYHIFFNRVEQVKETYNQPLTVTFPEIIDKSLGEIVDSLHINFMVDIGWLCLQYLLAAQLAKMLIIYESRVDTEKLPKNITAIEIPKPSAFGCHHSKISILKFKDNGIRIIVSTANLYSDDWENRTQG